MIYHLNYIKIKIMNLVMMKKKELPPIMLPLESTIFSVKASRNKGFEANVSTTKS